MIDEIPRHLLKREIERRLDCNHEGVCDYCGKSSETEPCKFPKRHAVKDYLGFLHLNLELLEAE